MDGFKSEYVSAYGALEQGKSRYASGRFEMRRDVLGKMNVKSTGAVFWRAVPTKYHEMVKGLYDMSIRNDNGLIDTLESMSYAPYGLTTYVGEGIDKYHLCDVKSVDGVMVPESEEGWEKLVQFVDAMDHAKKFSAGTNPDPKKAHKTYLARHMREAVEAKDLKKMGAMMGCMMWMMETPNMNQVKKASTSTSQAYEYSLVSSTILCRVLPKKAVVEEVAAAAEEVEESPKEKDLDLSGLADELAAEFGDEEW